LNRRKLEIEGVPQKDLDSSVDRVEQLVDWAKKEKIDPWALRAALLTALYDNAEEYFVTTKGTYREIAAFDNGVATALDSLKKVKEKT
jgi:hypothetical protein